MKARISGAALTLVDDDLLHALLQLVGGAQAVHCSHQHLLLLEQLALQPDDLILLNDVKRCQSGLTSS